VQDKYLQLLLPEVPVEQELLKTSIPTPLMQGLHGHLGPPHFLHLQLLVPAQTFIRLNAEDTPLVPDAVTLLEILFHGQ
jgi:hypothetical protein